MGHIIHAKRIDPAGIFLGGVGDDLPRLVSRKKGYWTPWLPAHVELQRRPGFDTMNCCQASRCALWSILANYHGVPFDPSDRYQYWASGCTEKGNSFERSVAGVAEHGAAAEEEWPWGPAVRSRKEYGAEPPLDVQLDGKAVVDLKWKVGKPVRVPTDIASLKDALERTPIWFCNRDHAMVLYDIDDRLRVWDTENDAGDGRGSFPLEYAGQIVAAYNSPFTPRGDNQETHMPKAKIADNAQVFEAEGLGRLGLKITSATGIEYIVVDEPSLVVSQFVQRNAKDGKFAGGPCETLTTADFDSFPHATFAEFSRLNRK